VSCPRRTAGRTVSRILVCNALLVNGSQRLLAGLRPARQDMVARMPPASKRRSLEQQATTPGNAQFGDRDAAASQACGLTGHTHAGAKARAWTSRAPGGAPCASSRLAAGSAGGPR